MTYFNKDCFDILPTIPDKSVDLIFCDLPYKQTNCKWDSDVDINKLWIEFKRIRKDTTPIIFTCTTKFGYELITANPKEFKFECVWQKSRKCGFLQARKRPLTNHEMVYFFYKKQPKYNYLKYHKYTKQKYDMRKTPPCEDGVYGEEKRPATDKRTKYEPTLPASVIVEDCCYGKKNDKINDNKKIGGLSYDSALPGSIQPFKSTKPSSHQTGKPIDLMEFLLKYWTDENDVVFDPTFGGGSMPIACKKLNRKFIGCELDKKFYDEFMINIEKY